MNTLVIVPTLNEENSVDNLILEWLRIPNVHILFVDDGSNDGTIQKIISSQYYLDRVYCLSRNKPRSYAKSLVEGFQWGLEKKYIYFCQIDCDSTQDPFFFPGMLEEAKLGKVVIGSRWVSGGSVGNQDKARSMLSKIINRVFRTFIGIKVLDATHSFRLFDHNVADFLSKQSYVSDHFFSLVEMLSLMNQITSVVEFPINARSRFAGRSSVTAKIARRYFLDFVIYASRYYIIKIHRCLSSRGQ